MDRLRIGARWSRFEADALFGSINDVVLTSELDEIGEEASPQRLHRFVAAHALTWRPSQRWEISVGESAVLTRRGGGVDLAFVNPLMVFLVAENDSSRTGEADDDNNLTAFGAVRAFVGGAQLVAELVVDDIQIDAADRENIPDQLAWRIGGSLAVPFLNEASVGVEYRRSDSYAYMRRNYAEVYQSYDQPLGSELGPDADEVRVSGEAWPSGRFRVAGGVAYWRRGALRIDQRPGAGAFGHAHEPYPSISAERPLAQRAVRADVAVELLDRVFPVALRVEVARLDNVNNQPTPPTTASRFSLVGSYRFRYP
jgi:hypothetical protein